MVPAKPAETELVPAEAKELITKLRAMAVYFDSASAEIKASEEQKIVEAAQLILESKDVRQSLTVGGYADLQGNADFNRELSLKRAKAVRDRLISKGVSADRLSVNHFGEDTSKTAQNDLWKSRRVEISLTGPRDQKKPAEAGSQGDPGELGAQAPEPTEPTLPATPSPLAPQQAQPLAPTLPTPGTANTPFTPQPAQPQPTIAQSSKDQLDYTAKKKAVEDLNPKVNLFFQTLADNLGQDFEALTQEAGYTVKTTDLFAKSTPAKNFNQRIESNNIGNLADAAFLLPPTGDSDEKMSDPHKTSDGWYIIRLDKVQESQPLSYEDAKIRVTVDLKKKIAREMMIEDAKALREKLIAAIKEGKTFEDAAKEAEQKVEKKDNLVAKLSYQGRSFGDDAFEPAKTTNPGEIAELELVPSEESPDQALIIFVEKREVLKDEQYNTQLDNTFNNLSYHSRLVAFDNWLNDRYKESDVVPPVLNN